MPKIVIKDITPKLGLPGGSVTITGKRFQPWELDSTSLHFTSSTAWIDGVSETTLLTSIPPNSSTGDVYIDGGGYKSNKFRFVIPDAIVGGLHLVDNPVVDNNGNIFATYSGNRGESTPVSVYRITKTGEKEVYLTGITNATSLAVGPDNALYIASRYDGKIYRSVKKNHFEIFSQGLGIAFGLAFNKKGDLYVGDRTGSIFSIDSQGQASFYASIPQSYIAFHMNFDNEDNLYVSNPVHMGENIIFRVDKNNGKFKVFYSGLSLFHGFIFDSKNTLYLAETKRNESRIIKIVSGKYVSTILTGTNFLGLTFDKNLNLVVATSNSLYLIEKGSY